MSSYGLWLSAAGMKVQDHRQALIANNIANANTGGFKSDLAVITQRRVESQASPDGGRFAHDVLDNLAGGLNVRPTYHRFGAGSIEATGRPLDAAVKGPGFFTVSDGTATRYTKDGRFAVNDAGELVLASQEGRWRVLDRKGAPIVLERGGHDALITSDGTIREGDSVVAQLGIAETPDVHLLRKVGGNLFDAGDAPMSLSRAALEPRALESSNVDVMRELVGMIEAARAYQLNSKMIQLQDEMTGRAVQTVGRLVA